MNHQKIYESIIEKAKSENRNKLKKKHKDYIYYERHHILPKCMKGTDDKDNLVLLTAKEHYVCHKLLTYIYSGNKKLMHAFWRMTWDKQGNKKLTSLDYAYARELKAKFPINIWNKGHRGLQHHSTETKRKMSESQKVK